MSSATVPPFVPLLRFHSLYLKEWKRSVRKEQVKISLAPFVRGSAIRAGCGNVWKALLPEMVGDFPILHEKGWGFFYPKLSESGIVGCKAFYYVELEVRQCSTSEWAQAQLGSVQRGKNSFCKQISFPVPQKTVGNSSSFCVVSKKAEVWGGCLRSSKGSSESYSLA